MFCVCSVVALRLDEPPGMKIFWSEIRVELPPVPIHLPGCRSPVCWKDFLLTCPATSVDDQLTVSTSCSAHWSVYAHAFTVLITAALPGWGSFKSHGVHSLAWIFSKVILTIQLGVSVCVYTCACQNFNVRMFKLCWGSDWNYLKCTGLTWRELTSLWYLIFSSINIVYFFI